MIKELDPDAINFVEMMLRHMPKKRMTPEQALNHKWLQMEEDKNLNKERNFPGP